MAVEDGQTSLESMATVIFAGLLDRWHYGCQAWVEEGEEYQR
jgi:hypothetical protein